MEALDLVVDLIIRFSEALQTVLIDYAEFEFCAYSGRGENIYLLTSRSLKPDNNGVPVELYSS